eukprot:114565-Chlamydomonas_euryale.AAC.1
MAAAALKPQQRKEHISEIVHKHSQLVGSDVLRSFGVELEVDARTGLMRVPARVLPRPHISAGGGGAPMLPQADGFVGGDTVERCVCASTCARW